MCNIYRKAQTQSSLYGDKLPASAHELLQQTVAMLGAGAREKRIAVELALRAQKC